MSKTEELNELFAEWQMKEDYRNNFFSDGIVDEDTWLSTSPQILYIAKEVHEQKYYKDGTLITGWSIAELLQREAKKSTWDKNLTYSWANIIVWTHGITNGYCYFKSSQHNYKENKENLLKCAVLNLKKSRGSSQADYAAIERAANGDKELILREIGIIDPDIIICCGTFDIIANLLGERSKLALETGKQCIVWNAPSGAKYTFIQHYHPNARAIRRIDLYNLLVLDLLAALNKGLIDIPPFSKVWY
jgi:hypothetical protein